MYLFLEECNACGSLEERIFTDSWTGKELCCSCLYVVIGDVTMSPGSERDNLVQLLVDNNLMETEEDYEGAEEEYEGVNN